MSGESKVIKAILVKEDGTQEEFVSFFGSFWSGAIGTVIALNIPAYQVLVSVESIKKIIKQEAKKFEH